MSIHISISMGVVPPQAEAAKLQETVGSLLVKHTSPEAASYAAERIARGVTTDMEVFLRQRASEVIEDLHGAGLRAAIVSEE
jgi:hypothetical protein